MTRHALVFNHFASVQGTPGGTRHADLFGRLEGWDTSLVSADRNYLTRRPIGSAAGTGERVRYRTVPTWPYSGNGPGRVLNWASYAAGALAVGVPAPRPDVVVGSTPHLLAPAAALAVARAQGVAFVLETRDLWPEILAEMGQLDRSTALYRSLERLARSIALRADSVVVLTEGVGHTIESWGVPPDRIHLVPNGADPADFPRPSSPAERERLRRRLGIEGTTVLYAGAHGPANGLDLVLDAAHELERSDPGVRLLLVGDGPAKAALVERAIAEGLTNVEFRSAVPKADMAELLAAVDIGLHALADVPLFAYGVSPNKLFDYLAAGLPVVTNTPGEVGGLVRDTGAGVAVPPAGMADGIRRLSRATPGERDAMGERGVALMSGSWSRANRAKALAAALDAAIERRAGR